MAAANGPRRHVLAGPAAGAVGPAAAEEEGAGRPLVLAVRVAPCVALVIEGAEGRASEGPRDRATSMGGRGTMAVLPWRSRGEVEGAGAAGAAGLLAVLLALALDELTATLLAAAGPPSTTRTAMRVGWAL